tara:strand:+ start:59 stop:250 length:192 start_codon:yes stop_codon:yes gene_type:complete
MTLIELILNIFFLASLILLFGKLFGSDISWWLIIIFSAPMIFACLPMWSEFLLNILKGKNPWK